MTSVNARVFVYAAGMSCYVSRINLLRHLHEQIRRASCL